jgi:hypothetical protein
MDMQRFETMLENITDIEKMKVLLKNTKKSKEHYTKSFRKLTALGSERYEEPFEKAYWSFVTAYEQIKYEESGKKRKATRLRKMFDDHGAIGAIERLVSKKEESEGFKKLVELDLLDQTAEYLVVNNKDLFTDKALEAAQTKIAEASL